MATVDAWLEGFLHGSTGLWVVLGVGLLFGLRHASADQDPTSALTTLVASEKDVGMRKAGSKGFAFGAWYVLGDPGVVAYPL